MMIRTRWLAMVCTSLWALSPQLSPAATACDPWVAKMVSVQGNVEVRRAGQTQWQAARLNDTYCPGDRIQVGDRGRADVTLVNQPVLRLDQDTTITLGEVREQKTSLIELIRGAIYFFSRLPRNLEVITAFVNAGVEGTEGLVQVGADRTLITIFEGKVLASNQAGSLMLTDGQSAVAEKGRAPVLRSVVRPRDAVHWALYYPPVAYFHPDEFPPGPGWQGMVRNSLEAYRKGNFQAAFESIKGIPDTLGEPRFFAYRASLLLAVGRFDEANRDIARALSLNPSYSEALALQAIVAVTQNEKERALEIAEKAIAAEPKSAAALIALSYARQAHFDLESARNSLEQAVQASPANTLAWSRLAELHMSLGELGKALEAAKKAVALDPNLSRTQTVLGFAHLTQVDTTAAKAAFEKALELDQADYLPRLGLGLATIREGDLPEGRREIEIASSLDPNNSIVRSYLGKAYFEEKRGPLDEREYAIAKELDSKDPTPWFYDAIAKQTTNRPIEALHALQKAIELNDNRAVYRSTLQLDSDLAARSAALGRIYSDLGFQQLALVEGWKSINADPTNFSAHRFLADSYSVLPRHEIARVSELLQSQLLQPLNMTPIQPRLAESNLFLIGAGGPAGLGFNEFNPLFNRNGINFQTSGLAGENSTYGGEGVLSAIYRKAAFSLGGFRFQTDGWRRNATQRDNIASAFLQFELSPQTSVQGEFRYRNRKLGDPQLNFFPDDFRPHFSDKLETGSTRFGLRHAISPRSTILGSLVYQHRDSGQADSPNPIFVGLKDKFPRQRALSGESQYLFRSQYFTFITGFGHFDIDKKHEVTRVFDFTPFGGGLVTVQTRTREDDRHTNMYLYSHLNFLPHVTFTFGLSGDIFRTRSRDTDSTNQINPKFGITWNPLPSTTLRAAVFRVLKRTLITDQTLEPTQVAGFNQFFDDINSTKSWRYGGAIDQKFSQTVFGGMELTRRDLNVPFRSEVFDDLGNLIEDRVRRGDGREYLGRAYLFWTPHSWLAFSAEFQREDFKNDDSVAFFFRRVRTNRLPLGLRFFHPAGLGLAFRTTYVRQSGEFLRRGAAGFQSGKDDFWIADAGVSYRLPHRYGLIAMGATNLFNRRFRYQETDLRNTSIVPGRGVFVRFTLALP
jgi:tetratricopeptide (TPR) repeat protein